ncbi:CBS-domain-containing membrane protein [Neobacillus niacini]|uniref:CBS domain-containing protein n=1 Tax=Neobacillus niacini TaxID=86668 RepID=UPI00277EF225|nr:CBS domain-containing protein [Neobacillus niacini]MDQ1005299.1 CBS-domain-containing membrane protein [Neobacillus niacini]
MHLLITDYMSTNFVSCTLEETLEDVTAKFLNTPSKILPVVNEENVLIGIVTQNKISRLLASKISFKTNIRDFYIANPISLSEMDSRSFGWLYLQHDSIAPDKIMIMILLSTLSIPLANIDTVSNGNLK